MRVVEILKIPKILDFWGEFQTAMHQQNSNSVEIKVPNMASTALYLFPTPIYSNTRYVWEKYRQLPKVWIFRWISNCDASTKFKLRHNQSPKYPCFRAPCLVDLFWLFFSRLFFQQEVGVSPVHRWECIFLECTTLITALLIETFEDDYTGWVV